MENVLIVLRDTAHSLNMKCALEDVANANRKLSVRQIADKHGVKLNSLYAAIRRHNARVSNLNTA